MKKLALLFVFVLFMLSAHSQDTIVFKDASEIEAKVTDITNETISYVKWNNPDGPKYTVNKSEIFYVKYQCGDKDVFSDIRTKSASKSLRPSADKFRFDGIRLQSYVYGGAIFMSHAGGPAVDLSLGVRLWDYAYIGVETGFHSLFSSAEMVYYSEQYYGGTYYDGWDTDEVTAKEAYIPLGVNLKGYIPTGKKIYPYVNCSLGGFFGLMDLGGFNGFYCQVGAGIDVKRFSFGIGYSGLVKYGTASCGYVKFGVRLGKW